MKFFLEKKTLDKLLCLLPPFMVDQKLCTRQVGGTRNSQKHQRFPKLQKGSRYSLFGTATL